MDQEREQRVRRLAVYYRLEMATLKAAGLGNDPNAGVADEAILANECEKNVKGNTKNAKQNIVDTILSI